MSVADEPPLFGSKQWVEERFGAIENSYRVGSLGAACRAARAVVREAADEVLARIERYAPTAFGRYVRDESWRERPSREQVANGEFRLELRFCADDGGLIRWIVERLDESETSGYVEAAEVASRADVFRIGPFVGIWKSGLLTIPLDSSGARYGVRVVPEGSASREEAEASLTLNRLTALIVPPTISMDVDGSVPSQIDSMRKQTEAAGRASAPMVLRYGRSILRRTRGEWIERVREVLSASGSSRLKKSHRLLRAEVTESTLVCHLESPSPSRVECVILVDASLGEGEELVGSGRSGRTSWSRRDIGGSRIAFRRSAALGFEEAVLPGMDSRARVWLSPDFPSSAVGCG